MIYFILQFQNSIQNSLDFIVDHMPILNLNMFIHLVLNLIPIIFLFML